MFFFFFWLRCQSPAETYEYARFSGRVGDGCRAAARDVAVVVTRISDQHSRLTAFPLSVFMRVKHSSRLIYREPHLERLSAPNDLKRSAKDKLGCGIASRQAPYKQLFFVQALSQLHQIYSQQTDMNFHVSCSGSRVHAHSLKTI